MADEKSTFPEMARDFVTRGLDALANKIAEKGDASPKAVAKLASLWASLSDEERRQVSAGIVTAATAAAMAIPATVAAARERAKKKKTAKKPEKKAKKKKG